MHRAALFTLAIGLVFGTAATTVPTLAQIALPTSFTYQGFIAANGAPLNGSANLTFSLWSDPVSVSVANRLGNPQTITGVPISNGRFTVELNAAGQFSAAAFSGDSRWLEVSVNGVAQLPRTRVLGVPYAHRATAANALRLPFSGSSSVAFGTTLQIVNDNPSGRSAITGSTGGVPAGATTSYEPIGVRGESSHRTGALGYSVAANGFGVVGINDASDGTGVLGMASGSGGVGVFGRASGAARFGVAARATEPDAYALLAEHADKNATAFLCVGSSILSGDVQLGDASGSFGPGKLILRNKNTDSILLQPREMIGGEFVQITFADPDFGTQPVGLRYYDVGFPARLDVVGGHLRGVIENVSTISAKHDITPVGSALSDLLKLRPVEFTWNSEFGGGRDVGLIAEDVAAIFPSVTSSRDGQVDSIRYSGVTALLVRGMQEQQEQLEAQRREAAALREQNAHLEERLRRLEAALERVSGAGGK